MRIHGLDDSRWAAGLDLLLDGRGTIELGDLASISWWTQGVGADSRVRVNIFSDGDPRFIPRSRVLQEIEDGMTLVHDAAVTHPRLEQLLGNEDVVWQYVHDYGKGSVKIADLTHDGTIAWTEDLRGEEYGDEEPNDAE